MKICKILIPTLLGLGVTVSGCTAQTTSDDLFTDEQLAKARESMVETQLRARDIVSERVLQAFDAVERHEFMPKKTWAQAYADHPAPIGEGQTISQPYIVAFMTQALDPRPEDKVLEIGTGSGYQAAILAEIVDHVYTIEIFESLGERARRTLREQGFENVSVKIGDGFKGWPEHAPFDKIIVTASPQEVPQPLIEQLREGGRMVIPVGGRFSQDLKVYTKKDGALVQEDSLPVRFVPMIDEDGKRY